MDGLITHHDAASIKGCLLGDDYRRNHLMFESHALGLVLILSIAVVLLYHEKLMKFYRPLAIVVNFGIIIKIFDCLSYFAYYPYGENEGNCSEIVLSRAYAFLLMFGELHQIYLLTNLIGLGNYKFQIFSRPIQLQFLLKFATVLTVSVVIVSIFIRRTLMVRNLLTVFAACTHIFFIRKHRSTAESHREG